MSKLDYFLNLLQERYLVSDQTISIDLEDFISGKSNKLLIAGLSGGGKSTLCRYLAKQYNAQCFETDHCEGFLDELRNQTSYDPKQIPPKNVFRVGYDLCVKPALKNNKRMIIEGGLVWQNAVFFSDAKKELDKHPVIIFGTSSLKSSIQVFMRRKQMGKKTGLYKLYLIYMRNFVQLRKMLDQYRNDRVLKGGDIQNFEVPKL